MAVRSRCRTSAPGRERPFEAPVHLTLSARLSTDEYHSTLRLVLHDHRGSRLHRSYHSFAAGGATISPSLSSTRIASWAERIFDSARMCT